MRAAAEPGECPFCGDPCRRRADGANAKRRRKNGDFFVTCGEPECATAYMRCWRRDARAVIASAKRVEALLEESTGRPLAANMSDERRLSHVGR